MHYIFLLSFILLIIFGPQLWARHTFKRYSKPLERIPGTGGELAQHLLKHLAMEHVKVEETTPGGDHYDPRDKTVRLSPDNYKQNSLTAVAVATHEVGHAIQHHRKEPKFNLRTRLAYLAHYAQKAGVMIMIAMPIVTAITKAPPAGLLMVAIGFGSMAVSTLVHFITLPVEIDASFGKALPILKQGNYITPEDEPAVRSILRAAAFTYVAASLASLLNLWRWLAILRRA